MNQFESCLPADERRLRFHRAVIIGLFATAVVLGACDADKNNETGGQERERAAHQARISDHLIRLAQKHIAIIDWRENLGEHSGLFPGTLYTVELEDRIVRTGGRPIAFISPLFDVRRRGSGVQMVFAGGFRSLSPRMAFVLNCPANSLDGLGDLPIGHLRLGLVFAVVAKINTVNKVLFGVSSSTEDDIFDQDGRSRALPLRLELSDDWFVAQGTCVEVSRIPD